jgi:hypothetical protein
MKELLRTSDPLIIAFASALLEGEAIESFELDSNISSLYGGIDAFPRRLMVREADFDAARLVMQDNDIDTNC